MKSKRYPVGTGGGRHPERAESKRSEALARAVAWSALGARGQVKALDAAIADALRIYGVRDGEMP